MQEEISKQELVRLLGNRDWRITSGFLYKLVNKYGQLIPFKQNAAQAKFRRNAHTRNIILKARQLGFSTYIDITLLDRALFEPNLRVGVIAQGLDEANDLFENKIRVAYDNLPEWLRSSIPMRTDRAGEMRFGHGSALSVGNSFRSGTLQHLHVSEFGKICAKFPDKAREIITGAFNTVADGMSIDVESTAEGSSGYFFDMCTLAMDKMKSGKVLGQSDFKFHFFPWFEDPNYALAQGDDVKSSTQEYFAKLKQDDYIRKFFPAVEFTEPMMRWWQAKFESNEDDICREYPSTPKEAFDMAIRGSYFENELTKAREQGRVGRYMYDPSMLVNTVWDIGGAGGGDDTAIWFFQVCGREVRIIDYWEGTGYSLKEIAGSIVKGRNEYRYDGHYLPHDAKVHEQGDGTQRIVTVQSILGRAGVLNMIPIADGINAAREIFPNCYFNEATTDAGLKHLAAYSRAWDVRNACFKDTPKHDEHSHAGSAFRYLAQAVKQIYGSGESEKSEAFEVDYSKFL